jgi:dienelactone hydrolase
MNKDLIDDTQALLGGHADANGTTRRFALKAAIGVGYAASAMPIIAQTAIKTPVAGLVAGEVTIDVNGFKMPGFCWGGRITWLYAAHQPQLKAGVAWYGRLVGNTTAQTPAHPLALASQLKAPVLGLYGAADTGIPLDTVEKMKAALAQGPGAAKSSEFVVYPEAPHAFHADYRPTYRKAAADDGWQRMLNWFKKQGAV